MLNEEAINKGKHVYDSSLRGIKKEIIGSKP